MPTPTNSIGAVTVTFIRGEPACLIPEIEVYRRKGLDGYGASFNGYAGALFTLRVTTYAATEADAEAFIGLMEDMIGTVVTVTINRGGTEYVYTNCLMLTFDENQILRKNVLYNGSATVVRVEMPVPFARVGA